MTMKDLEALDVESDAIAPMINNTKTSRKKKKTVAAAAKKEATAAKKDAQKKILLPNFNKKAKAKAKAKAQMGGLVKNKNGGLAEAKTEVGGAASEVAEIQAVVTPAKVVKDKDDIASAVKEKVLKNKRNSVYSNAYRKAKNKAKAAGQQGEECVEIAKVAGRAAIAAWHLELVESASD